MATVTAEIAAVDNLPLSIVGYPTVGHTTGAVGDHEIAWAALKSMRDQWASLEAGGGGGGGGWATTIVAAPTGVATTDTTAVQDALNGGGLIALAPGGGTYLVNPLTIALSGTTLDLNGATLQGNGTGTHDATLRAEGTGITTADNKRNLTIRNGRIITNVTPPAFLATHQHQHGIVLSGVSDVLLEQLEIVGPRGDGVYLGSGYGASVERHNERVTIRKCFIDGVNNLNRNCVSIIDCSTFRMEDTYFYRYSDDTMPGPFDVEPNSTYNIVRDIKVENCTADSCGGGVGMFALALIVNTQAAMTVPIQDIQFHNITVRNSNKTAFFAQQAGTPTADTAPNNIVVDGLHCYNVWKPFALEGGTHGVKIRNLNVYGASGPAQAGWSPILDATVEDFHFWQAAPVGGYCFELFNTDNLTIRNGNIEGNDSGYVFRLSLGSGSVGNSNNLDIHDIKYRNLTGLTALEFLNKHASHTITGTFKFYNIDQPDLAVTAISGMVGGSWDLLASASLAAAAVSTGALTIAKRDQLCIEIRVPSTSAADSPALRFNADVGSNYNARYITAPPGIVTLNNVQASSVDRARLSGLSSTGSRTYSVHLANQLNATKVGKVSGATGTGTPATNPDLEVAGQIEWSNTVAQITSVELRTLGGTATLGVGTSILIFGRNAV